MHLRTALCENEERRNGGSVQTYSVFIWLENQLAADGFYCSFSGKRFKPSESFEYTESGELACIPLPDYTELPSCSVCLERLDPDASGIQSTLCDHSFQCACASKWTYLSCQVYRLCQHVEKAIFLRTHDLQYKLEKYAEEKKAVEDASFQFSEESLTKRQELLQIKLRDLEERERLSLE
ncbi:BRAP2 RING ZnF UBP domain-containing protein 1-like [Primulina tabacum]|uniref:BRAP2 RING ZnF UBP domain-containing protein 1-like n=1 Tax=Primulina tabacum TaxID=48773 RepID=UPI003F5A6EC1